MTKVFMAFDDDLTEQNRCSNASLLNSLQRLARVRRAFFMPAIKILPLTLVMLYKASNLYPVVIRQALLPLAEGMPRWLARHSDHNVRGRLRVSASPRFVPATRLGCRYFFRHFSTVDNAYSPLLSNLKTSSFQGLAHKVLCIANC